MEMGNNHNTSEFLDLLPELVFEVNANLNILFLNKTCNKILGYTRDELINRPIPIEKIVVPNDIPKLKENIKKSFNGISISGNIYRVFTKSNKVISLELYNSLIKRNGAIVGLRVIAIDVTEKGNNNKKTISQEKHYRKIFQNYPIPYQSLDINGNILDVNPAWEKILGYSKNEIIGKNFTYILTDNSKHKFKKTFGQFIDNGEIKNILFNLLTKKGLKIHVNYTGNVEYSEDGDFNRTHCVFNDITLQNKAKQTIINSELRLRELNATKDKFFSIIAHDLKNPFNDLMGFTQLLDLNIEKYNKSKIKQFVKIIHQSSKLAYNLLENLLAWSGSQTGTLKFNPEKILINNLVNENIDLLESTAKNKNIKIYSELNKDIYVVADNNMLRTILRNLISNSIKYTNQGGFIKISSSCKKDFCQINISDNGIGISKENIDKIFKIDESFSTTGTKKETGTGLGLLLCKEFVAKNKGKLMVKSELNKGSTFSFTLPLLKPEY